MAKYMIIYHYPDGSDEEDDNYGEYYSSEEEAMEAGLYGLSCFHLGGENLEMSNPGDYPYDESEEADFEVVQVE